MWWLQVGLWVGEWASEELTLNLNRRTWCLLAYLTINDAYFYRACSYCYPGSRSTTYSCGDTDDNATVTTAPDNVLIRHEKNCSCPANALIGISDNGPIRVPCCCYLPYIDTYDARTNTKLGSTKLLCNCKPLLCPKFAVYDHNNSPKYLIRPDLCCGNCCYKCPKCRSGAKCCFIPFYIRDYHSEEKLDPEDGDVAIIDLYIGLKHECCTKKNLYSVKYPSNADNSDKATLMGATLLYDMIINEQNNDWETIVFYCCDVVLLITILDVE